MKSSNRIINKVLVSLPALLLITMGLGELSQTFAQGSREGRFPKMRFQRTDVEGLDSTGDGDFYTEFLKGKTVIVQLFYQECTGGVCEEGMRKLEQVQQALGDDLGKEVFIYSITLKPDRDSIEDLKRDAALYEAKPLGWSFLRGNAEDTVPLRNALRLAGRSPAAQRQLFPLTDEEVENGRAIVAKAPAEWQPRTLTAVEGDRIVWKLDAGSPGSHGLRITNWDQVKEYVEVQAALGEEPFTGTTSSTETPGTVLLRLKFKSAPLFPSKITYECTVHGEQMAGEVSLGQPHSGMFFLYDDTTGRDDRISIDKPTSEILKAVYRLRDRAETAPAGGSVAAPSEITVDAGRGIRWSSGGNSSTPTMPLKVTVKKGQTLVFRHIDPGVRHGIGFVDESLVLLAGEMPGDKPNAVLKQTDTFERYGRDIVGPATPQDLARFEVIEDITTAPAFECTFHGPQMAGSVEAAPAGGSVAPPSEITVDAGLGVAWKSGGRSSTRTVPLEVTAKKGQTLVFRQVETNPNRSHGIVFTTPDLVLLKTDTPGTKPNAVLKQTDNLGLYDMDVPGGPNPQELARFEVIQDITTAPAFECTFHGSQMAGSVAFITPSMQRRLLRFVNRAYTPEDLMKSPQETRMKSEHRLPEGHERGSGARAGFAPNVGKSLIDRRPLDGYRDVRECLPSYEQPGGAASFDRVLDSVGPEQFGEWTEVASDLPPVMHAALLHTGQVLFLTDTTDSVLWDPAGGFTVLQGGAARSGLTDILFCSGHSFLSDGRLLAVGGGGSSSGDAISRGWKFDPTTSRWSRTRNDMTFRRWYPSLVTLGREPEQVLIAAGLSPSGPAPRMEVYSEATDQFELVTATGPTGDLLFPGTYPSLRALPGGEILHVATGWGVSGSPCNQSPDGAAVDPTALFTFSSSLAGSWRLIGVNHRLKGMNVVLFEQTFPFVQSFVVGGGSLSQSGTAATMNLSTMSPAWDLAFPLLEARVHPNTVVLPDGTVFICGGMESSAPTPPDGGRCELFDPRPGAVALKEMDEMTRFRHYHSVALLLPDGSVMAAGGAVRGGCSVSEQNTIEVFKPPYLFRGPQPTFTLARDSVEHGATIEIKTPAASGIQRIVLARPGAVTHQTDSEQRIIPLSFRVTGPDRIEAIAPGGPGANPIAPRGFYMLFILNQQGVPSISKWVFLGGANPNASEVADAAIDESSKLDRSQLVQAGVVTSFKDDRFLVGVRQESLAPLALGDSISTDRRAVPQGAKRLPAEMTILNRNKVRDIEIVDRNGKSRSLREYSGRPHVVVLIEGAFCKLCMAQLAEFQRQLDPSRVPIVVVTPINDLEELADIPFDVFADPEFKLFKGLEAFGDEPLHGMFVFNSRDEVLLKDIGVEPYTDFAAIKRALRVGKQ